MANCSLLGTLLRSHGKLHPSPMRVERAMLEYLQYMPLVTLFQYAFERLKCELNILSKKAKSPSLATVLYCLDTLHKSHTFEIKHFTFQMEQ